MTKGRFFSKILILLLCVALVVPLLSSCKKNKTTSVKIPLATVPTCFDPQISYGTNEENIINNCLEGLVRIDKNGNITNGVASSWAVSSDGLAYTFTLRSDAKWHLPSDLEDILGEDYKKTFDTRVTAYDFAFGITRGMDPETDSPMADSLSCIQSVSAESDTKLVITLKHPNVNFLTVLASPVAMPCNENFFEATAGRYGLKANLLLCNGPYYLGSIDEENGIVIYKNSDYKGSCTALFSTGKFLTTKSFLSSSAKEKSNDEKTLPSVFSLLTSKDGGYDIATVTKAESEALSSDFTVDRYKNTVKAFCFNLHNDALNNYNIRMALAHATNPELFTGDYPLAEGIVPSCCGRAAGVSYRSEGNIIKAPAYDLSTAESFYKKAVQNNLDEDGKQTELSLNLSLFCLKEDETDVKRVLQDWQKIFGVSLSVTVTACDTQAEVDTAVESGNFDVAYTSVTASEFLATDFLGRFVSSSGKNIVGLNDSTYDELVSKAINAASEEELIRLTRDAEARLLQSGCLLPTCSADGYLAKNRNAEKVTVRPSGNIYALYTLK